MSGFSIAVNAHRSTELLTGLVLPPSWNVYRWACVSVSTVVKIYKPIASAYYARMGRGKVFTVYVVQSVHKTCYACARLIRAISLKGQRICTLQTAGLSYQSIANKSLLICEQLHSRIVSRQIQLPQYTLEHINQYVAVCVTLSTIDQCFHSTGCYQPLLAFRMPNSQR